MADLGHLHAMKDLALERIEDQCQTTDLERNGCELDAILLDFLRSIGCEELADSAESVECWRA